MKSHTILVAAALATTTFLAGCAAPDYPGGAYPAQGSQGYPAQGYPAQGGQRNYANFGVVDSIQQINAGSGGGIGAGAVIGGIVGGLLGNQVGGGTGRGLATAAGVVGGAVAGNQVQQRNDPQRTAFQIGVRLDNGTYQTVQQDSIGDIGVGSRVRVENGRVFRY